MKKIEKVLLIGLGAIGSIYATKIHDSKSCVFKVLVNKKRFEKYFKEGLVFNCKTYHFDYVLDTQNDFKADLIIIATKAKDFSIAAEMIKNFVAEDTVILSLLNGISSEDFLVEKYGPQRVLYSYYIGHASVKTGNSITFSGNNKIVFGDENNSSLSQNVLRVKEFFDEAGINYEIPENMYASMWKKFIINVGLNQTSAVFRADYEMLQTSKEARDFARDLMQEAVEIAKMIGINSAQDFVEDAFSLIDSMPPELKTSMLQDVEQGKETEVDIFAGEVVRLGKKFGIKTPKNLEVLSKIKGYTEGL